MKRRAFLRYGAVAVGAPAALPLLNLSCTRAPAATESMGADGNVRISSNENPLGLPPSLREAVTRGMDEAHQYPGASAGRLAEALAARHDCDPESIVLGNGSADVLRMIVHARIALDPRLRLVVADPTFEQVETYARPLGVVPVRVPLLADSHEHDLPAMRAAARATSLTASASPSPSASASGGGRGALVYICNPNNPTGGVTPVSRVQEWIEGAPPEHFFLVDEAYFEFVDHPDYGPLDAWARDRPNVVVTRTFSKVYGMAGLRVGYAVAHPETAAHLRQFATATSPNHLANVAGLAALGETAFVQRSLAVNRESLRVVEETLESLGLPWMESHTNFVMHGINGDVGTYAGRMRDAGILVGRPFPPLLNHNRVSLGTPDQMRRWAETLHGFRERGWV